MDEEVIAILLYTQVRMEGGLLLVTVAMRLDLNYIDTVVLALLKVWRFTLCTASRWLSVGNASRRMTAAEILWADCHDRLCLSPAA